MAGHKEIKAYWDKKIVKEEANIKFKVKKILIDGDESAVEWEAEFDDVVADQRVKMYDAAFLQFRDGKICSLREVWAIGNGLGRLRRILRRIFKKAPTIFP